MNGTMKWFSKISFINSIIDGLRKHSFEPHEDDLEYRAVKIKEALNAALSIQASENNFKPKILKKLQKQIEAFEDETRIGHKQPASVILSFTLALIDELEQHITNYERLGILGVVSKRLNWLITHKEIDPKLDKFEFYDTASGFLKTWERILN